MFPNNNSQVTSRIVDVVGKGTSGIVILPQNPTVDAIAASTSLYLGLLKMGKTVAIVCTSPVQSDLSAADKIHANLSVGGIIW